MQYILKFREVNLQKSQMTHMYSCRYSPNQLIETQIPIKVEEIL